MMVSRELSRRIQDELLRITRMKKRVLLPLTLADGKPAAIEPSLVQSVTRFSTEEHTLSEIVGAYQDALQHLYTEPDEQDVSLLAPVALPVDIVPRVTMLARGHAALEGRFYAIPDDVDAVLWAGVPIPE